MIFLELSEAFGIVNHSILDRLSSLGTGDLVLLWLWPFLSGHLERREVVSTPWVLGSGVPQELIVSPMINIYRRPL